MNTILSPDNESHPQNAISIMRDLSYGIGVVGFSSDKPMPRSLTMDVYAPADECEAKKRPALVLAFGGAFHRGTKTDDRVDEAGSQNSSIAEYCVEFARRGYVCFSIDYRLTTEDPDPGTTPILCDPTTIDRSRIDTVRAWMGLGPSTAIMLGDGIEAAIDDMQCALEFVVDHASHWYIDASKIAVGGFSAGAIMAIATAYTCTSRATAVVSLSGAMGLLEMDRYLKDAADAPPGIFFHGSDDLPGIELGCKLLCERLRGQGVIAQRRVVPGGTHFYKRDAMSESDNSIADLGLSSKTVQDGIDDFLKATWSK